MIASILHLFKEYGLDKEESYEDYFEYSYTKPVSILVPAFNEEAGIKDSVRSLLSLHYPEYEVIVINDGSKDNTLIKVIEEFDMKQVTKVITKSIPSKEIKAIYQSETHPNLYLIDKDNGGKADALNAGLNVGKYPYFCSVDGDSILENDAFAKVMKPIINSDGKVIASSGTVRIANGCEIKDGKVRNVGLSSNPLVVMQVIEYLRAFLIGRIGLSRYNLVLIISGAFGVFSKKWVIEVGGYSTKTVGEDMELVVKLHRLISEKGTDHRIEYVPDPVCWTEAPESTTYLRRQRSRWHRGLIESLWTHRSMTLNKKYGGVGMISFPYFWIVEFLGPLVELGGYIFMVLAVILGGVYLEFAVLLFLVSLLYGSLFSMMAVVLEEWSMRKYPSKRDLVNLFLYSLTETIWYRPLTVLWRCEGIFRFFIKDRSWGEMKRKGVAG